MTEHTRTEQIPTKVIYKTECDGCRKIENGSEPKGWHRFSSHHSEWGNDSVESWEYFDACSWECYLEIVRREYGSYQRGHPPSLVIDGKNMLFVRSMLEAMSDSFRAERMARERGK